MSILLIDDRGEIWGAATIGLRRSFGPTWSDEEFSQYVVKNVGFVAINLFGQSCQVRLRPKFMTGQSFDTLLRWLSERSFARIVICHFDTDWRLELHGGNESAVARLHALVDRQRLERPDEFLARKLPISQVPGIPALRSLMTNWGMLSRNLHSDGLRTILHQLTQGRYILVRQDESSGRIILADIGTGYLTYDKDWLSQAPGQPFELQPDQAYGQWAAQHYGNVLQRSMPCFDEVDALISNSRYGRYRLRYKRLTLPFHRGDGANWLLSSSVMDDCVDLRSRKGGEGA